MELRLAGADGPLLLGLLLPVPWVRLRALLVEPLYGESPFSAGGIVCWSDTYAQPTIIANLGFQTWKAQLYVVWFCQRNAVG